MEDPITRVVPLGWAGRDSEEEGRDLFVRSQPSHECLPPLTPGSSHLSDMDPTPPMNFKLSIKSQKDLNSGTRGGDRTCPSDFPPLRLDRVGTTPVKVKERTRKGVKGQRQKENYPSRTQKRSPTSREPRTTGPFRWKGSDDDVTTSTPLPTHTPG